MKKLGSKGWSGPQDLKEGWPWEVLTGKAVFEQRDSGEQNIYQGVKIGKNILGGGNTWVCICYKKLPESW